MATKESVRQMKWAKANMDTVRGQYKKDFVAEFKTACCALGISQSSVIRQAMEKVIAEAKARSLN